MRVLSLSHRLQNRFIDNHTIFNAPSLLDYDAIVLDAAGVFDSVRAAAEGQGEFLTHAAVPVANGDATDGAASIADILQRRRDEMQRALERGALVLVFLAPLSRFGGIAGLQGFDRYFLLPAPDGMAWDAQTIRGGEGATAAVVDHHHPFVSVFEAYRRDLLYRAYFNDRAPGFAKHARIFIRSGGGAPLGVEFPVLRGRVIFLPTPRHAGSQSLAGPEGQAIVAAMHDAFGRGLDEERPRWLSQYPVPGLAAREAALKQAEAELQHATEAVEAARAAVAEATAVRDVLWLGHELGTRRAAQRCAELLGFDVSEDEEGHVTLSEGGTRIHLEAGAANEAVDMAPHYRLRQRLDAILEQRARAERGVVVANGQRLTRPEERKREFADSLRVASEAVGYALLPAHVLYRAVVAALEGAPEETLAEVRRRIAATNGLVAIDDLIAPEREAEAEGAEEAEEDATGPAAAGAAGLTIAGTGEGEPADGDEEDETASDEA